MYEISRLRLNGLKVIVGTKKCDAPMHTPTIKFLAHLSRRRIGELIVCIPMVRRPSYVVRRPSVVGVVHNAQTSSYQKLLGRSKPNLMWSLLG